MKSKIFKRSIAIMLCMVIVLSGSGYLLAETFEEGNAEVMEASVTDVPAEDATVQEETTEAGSDATVEVEIPAQQEEASAPAAETPAAEAPAAETPAAESAEPIRQLTYEDDDVKVIVDATEAGNIPDGATLSVTPLEKKEVTAGMSAEEKAKIEEVNAQYDLTETKLQEKAENEEYDIAGFLAYDITFVDADGNKLEPNGNVKVSMEYKKAVVPEEVKQAEAEAKANNDEYKVDVTVMHLEEDSNGTVKEVVDMVADKNEVATVDTTTTSKVKKAEFVTNSFSKYTVTWKVKNRTVQLKAHYGYEDDNGQFAGFDGVDPTQLTKIPEVKETKEEIILGNYSNTDVFEKYGYIYTKVYMSTSGEYSGKSECYSLQIRSKDSKYYLQKRTAKGADRQNVGDAIGSGATKTVDVYYVYEKVDPLTTVETVDHSSDGITMRMIDYDSAANGIAIDGGYGDGTIKQNLLQRVLKDGYPVTKDGASLSSLFSGGTTVNHLFRKDIYDATGYYEYSCFENYAYLGNGTDFTVYNQIGTPEDSESYYFRRGNFMPYNEIVAGKYSSYTNNYDENGKELAEGDARKDEKLYKTQGDNNFYFGMYVEADFTQQKDGKVTHNGTKSPMKYEFNGDDDLWVYIDDVLILDIGGIHDAHSGYIDFATGEVGWYDCTTSEHLNPHLTTTTIKAMFQAAGKFPDGTNWDDNKVDDYFRGNTFKDYTTHTFKMFYMERGKGASNLHVKFNLPIVPKHTVNVQKVVEDENGNEVDYAEDIDFCFKIKVKGNDYANQTYSIIENGQETGVTGVTDENGCFTLKHSQTARFKNILESYNYQVQELGAFLNGYEVKVNGVEVWTPQEDGSGDKIPSADSGEISVGSQPTAVFINTVKNTATLSISKNLKDGRTDGNKEFSIRMRLNNQIYTGKYTIGDTQYTCENGIIKIKAGQTATISGLPYGVAFDVQELLDGSYLPTYAVTGEAVNILLPEFDAEGKNTNDVSSASAQMIGDCRVTVTNDEVETGTGTTNIVVVKNWMNPDKYELPPYVEVTLYVDTNSNGVFDDADTPVAGAVTKQLKEENRWRAEWNNQAADTDYVVKETYPLGYELYETSIDNSLSDIVKIGDRNTPNNNTMFNIGKNNILLVKETGDQYFLWSPINLKLDRNDINKIVGAINDMHLKGAGNLDSTNISYKFGITDQEGIGLTKNDNGWTLSFSKKSNWAMFWGFSYTRNQTVTLTNNLDEDANTSLIVNKEWVGDIEATRPKSITVQLYKNDEAYGDPVEITAEQNWKHEFTELPFYTNNDDGTFTKNVYTVKETKVGSETVEAGMAGDYQSSEQVNDDGSITIINTKKWQIIKVSENSKDYVLAGAVFTLETADKTNVYYGVSGNDGVINWYTDVACTMLYNENFPDGIYNLFETKAPAGYMLSSERWTINMENRCPASVTSTIKDDLNSVRKDGKDTLYFENTPLYDLPSAGGPGIFWYTIGGILLMMAAALILYKNKCREVLNR